MAGGTVTVGGSYDVERNRIPPKESHWKGVGIAAAAVLLVGIVALAMIAYLQSSGVTQTRVDFVGSTNQFNAYVISERVTQFVSKGAIDGLTLLAFLGGVFGVASMIASIRALCSYEKEGRQVGMAFMGIGIILTTMAIVAAVFVAKSTTTTALTWAKDVHGLWQQKAFMTTTMLNVGGLAAFKTAAIVLTAVGGAGALAAFALHRRARAQELHKVGE